MKNTLCNILSKHIALLISAVIIFQSNTPLFAQFNANNFQSVNANDIFDMSVKVDQAYLNGENNNQYENEFTLQADTAIKNLKASPQAARIKQLQQEGVNKYGQLAPMYVHAAGLKQLNKLQADLMNFLYGWFGEPALISYENFKKEYEQTVKQTAQELITKENTPGYMVFQNPSEAIAQTITALYPPERLYNEYKQEAEKEISYRKDNADKLEKNAYRVVRAYIEIIGAENFSPEITAILLNSELNGLKLITAEERKDIYDYNIKRLQTNNLKLLEIDITSTQSAKKVSQMLLSDIIERILIAGYLCQGHEEEYGTAVENIIYKSEETSGFAHILSAGFSALLAAGLFNNLDSILAKYNKAELSDISWTDWLNLQHYSEKLQNINGKYLGGISRQMQYNTDYAYGNIFADFAQLLAEDDRPQSIKLLQKYSTGKEIDKTIKPFLAGALLSKKAGPKAETYAINLANMNLGDIEGIYEYDIDHGLAAAYPAIKNKLGEDAIINKEKLETKQNERRAFGYLNRAAASGDIAITIWGTIGLIKLGGKAINLSKATYTALKAGRITNTAKRLSYIKANYTKMAKYISARKSMLRFKNTVKLRIAGKGSVSAREIYKLQADLDRKILSGLDTEGQKAAQIVKESVKPTKKQISKTEFIKAQYETQKAKIDYNLNIRSSGKTYNEKTASYLDKVRAYNNYGGEIPQAPAYTPAELKLAQSQNIFYSSIDRLKKAKQAYKDTKWWNRTISNPLREWWLSTDAEPGLGIAAMETGEGTTIAKAFNLKGDYTYKPGSDSGLFTPSAKESQISKFYKWLDKNNLPYLSKGLKFVNNKATFLGTALLMNYNIATITPEALNAGRGFTAATELVVNSGKTGEILASGTSSIPASLNFTGPKPVNLIDPKILQAYNTIPLPKGNIVSSLNFKPAFNTAADFARGLFSYKYNASGKPQTNAAFEQMTDKQNFLKAESARPFLKDIFDIEISNQLFHHHIFNKYTIVAVMSALSSQTFAFIPATQREGLEELEPSKSINIVEIPNVEAFQQYKDAALQIYKDILTPMMLQTYTVNNMEMTVGDMIAYIEQKQLDPSGTITLGTYEDYIQKILNIAPRLTTNTFEMISKYIINPAALQKIIMTSPEKKTHADKVNSYLNHLKMVDIFDNAILFPNNLFVNIPQFPSIKSAIEDNSAIIKNIQWLTKRGFTKANIGALFTSQNLRHILRRFIDAAPEDQSLPISQAILKAKSSMQYIKATNDGSIVDVKGCLINTNASWEAEENITPERIGISVEKSVDDIGLSIVEWMHKNNIPLQGEAVSFQEISSYLVPWAEDMLGVNKDKPAHYIINKEGESHIYNNDYTKRIRLGAHELLGKTQHIHIESIEKDNWRGIFNMSYYFTNAEQMREQNIAILKNLRDYFKSNYMQREIS